MSPEISNHGAERPAAPIGGQQPLFVLMPSRLHERKLLSAAR